MPTGSSGKLMKALEKETLFRQIATVHRAYKTGYRIYAKVCKDKVQFVAEGDAFPIYDGLENFTNLPVDSHKAAAIVKLDEDFVNDAKSYSSIHTIRGVLRPAFQMAVDGDILVKNPFGFQLAGVLVNDAVTSEANTKDQMRKFLKFVHDDVVYCKYYEVVYILFHTGMRDVYKRQTSWGIRIYRLQ